MQSSGLRRFPAPSPAPASELDFSAAPRTAPLKAHNVTAPAVHAHTVNATATAAQIDASSTQPLVAHTSRDRHFSLWEMPYAWEALLMGRHASPEVFEIGQ